MKIEERFDKIESLVLETRERIEFLLKEMARAHGYELTSSDKTPEPKSSEPINLIKLIKLTSLALLFIAMVLMGVNLVMSKECLNNGIPLTIAPTIGNTEPTLLHREEAFDGARIDIYGDKFPQPELTSSIVFVSNNEEILKFGPGPKIYYLEKELMSNQEVVDALTEFTHWRKMCECRTKPGGL